MPGRRLDPPNRRWPRYFVRRWSGCSASGMSPERPTALGHFALIALMEKGCSVLRQVPRSVAPEPSVPQNKPLGALMRDATSEKGVGAVVEALFKAMIGKDK
jgi:hypothetical protein